MADVYDNDTEQ